MICMVFIDIEKAYDKVLREVLKWKLMKKEIPKTYINMVDDMYHKYHKYYAPV